MGVTEVLAEVRCLLLLKYHWKKKSPCQGLVTVVTKGIPNGGPENSISVTVWLLPNPSPRSFLAQQLLPKRGLELCSEYTWIPRAQHGGQRIKQINKSNDRLKP